MAAPSVTYSFTNGTTADATQVNQNFTDLINGLSDGTKDLSILNIVIAGKATITGGIAAASVIATISNVMTICGGSSGGRLAHSDGVASFSWTSATCTSAKPLTVSDTTESTVAGAGALIVSGGIHFAKGLAFASGAHQCIGHRKCS